MFNYIFIGLSTLCVILLLKNNKSRLIYMKGLILPIISAVFIALLVIFPKTAVNSALRGINLWLDIAFPSLFPFFVGVEILNSTGIMRAVGVLLEPVMRPIFNLPGCSSFPFVMGVTSGYPVGAKITSSMREQGMLTKTEAERLIAFSNNSGPLFIIGAVSVGMYKMPALGPVLLSCHIAACVTVGVLFRFYGKKRKINKSAGARAIWNKFRQEIRAIRRNYNTNLGSLLGDAVRNSVMTMLAIGGFIILFSVIINILLDTGVIGAVSDSLAVILSPLGAKKDVIEALLCGFFEITTGTNMASKAVASPFIQQLAATSMIIGWAGLSVHSQVLSIVAKTDISMKPYLFGKLLQGIFAALYTVIWIKTTGFAPMEPAPAFSPSGYVNNLDWHNYLYLSLQGLGLSVAIIIICTLLSMAVYIVSKPLRR